ncbi:flagellar motor switch protein FliG [Candidatus Nitrospira neomarina]|uniref:Flagellar motor switch protein FliG n=1 Tax=Candidatus Nitrospira neomarina TaxID=3020899 RepID=A0AA96JX29_9BACT|nr:flagellar motor switch protein FliG [Candidatus Nitrospira neomarina]WNM62760.1 flagellar motor switch protein FliG [Candidatus Nitrospira neomarina]
MNSQLSGYEKAAILLLAIGESAAVEVLKVLDQKDIRQIGAYLGALVNVGQDEHRLVLKEFRELAGTSGLSVEGKTYLSKILNAALGKDKARRILSSLNTSENAGFETLKSLDAASIANLLAIEHPQTGALILANLESDHAAQILSLLPANKRDAIVYRLATTEEVSPNMLDELNAVLQEELRLGSSKNAVAVGGTGLVAEILNSVKRNVEGEILTSLESKNPEIAEEIRGKMFVFEDLENVDDRGMQELLREVSKEELLLALKPIDGPLRDKFFKNMSSRAAESLKEDMETRGPVKLSDVETAQQNIIKTVQRLAGEGRVVLGGKGEEQMV